jgi:hypothetical protein
MGTLFDQSERKPASVDLEEFLSYAARMAGEYDVTIDVVVRAKTALELQRRNELYLMNGDIKDEQLAGFGELLKDLTLVISNR